MTISQSNHPARLLLERYADGTAAIDERRAISEHIERCADCAGYVQRVVSLSEALRALPITARRIPPIDPSATRLADSRRHIASWRSVSPLMAAAAAAVIFGAGVAVGTATRRLPAESSPPPTELRPALDVQQAGTSYIAALARLNASGRGNDRGVIYAREVALATLYGAAAEAVQPLGADAAASELLALARTVRDRAAARSPMEQTP